MNLQDQFVEDAVLITVMEDHLDIHVAMALINHLTDHIENGTIQIIIDLSQVCFVDSVGIGRIVYGFKIVKAQQGRLVICGIQEQVARLFHTMRVDRTIECFDDASSALDALLQADRLAVQSHTLREGDRS